MGLFDSFQFDPQSYNPIGGLLQHLQDWQWQNPNSQGFTPLDSGIGNAVKPPVIAAPPSDNEPQRGPPLNISPPPMAAPQAPQASPLANLFSGISNGIADNPMTLMALGSGIMQGGFGKGLQMAMLGADADAKAKGSNLTVAALTKKGIDPDTARIVAGNPQLLTAMMQDKLGLVPKTEDIKEFEYARNQGFQGSLVDWMKQKSSATGGYGLQPVYGIGADGKPTIVQLSKTGSAIEAKMPEGITFSKEPIKLDAGTHFVLLDPITRQNVGVIPKDIAGVQKQEEIGKATGKAVVDLPNVLAKGEQSLALIDSIAKDPYLGWVTGVMSVSSKIPGTPMYDTGKKITQLQGKAFLEAFETLKGSGQITEVEGKKATEAIARLDTPQSEKAFRSALAELRDVVSAGLDRARQRAGVVSAAPPPQQKRIKIDVNGNEIQ